MSCTARKRLFHSPALGPIRPDSTVAPRLSTTLNRAPAASDGAIRNACLASPVA
jgi:hypothetical protein